MGLNIVAMLGRLTKDPNMVTTKSGESMCTFSIAYNHNKEDASFFNVTCFGKTADTAEEYLSKGKQVAITGYLRQRSWEDDNGNKRNVVEIIANNITFVGSKEDDTKGESTNKSKGKPVSKSAPNKSTNKKPTSKKKVEEDEEDEDYAQNINNDDDIPF